MGWLWITTPASRWPLLDFSMTSLTQPPCHQRIHQRQHQQEQRRARTDQIQRIRRQREIRTTTALEETLRLAYLFVQRRMPTSTRHVCTTAWRTVEREYQ